MKKGESLALLQLTISSGVNKILKYLKYTFTGEMTLTSFPMENTSLLDLSSGAPGKFTLLKQGIHYFTSWKIIQGKQNNGQPVKDKNGGPAKEKQPVDITFHSWTFCSTSWSTCVEMIVTYLKSTRVIPLPVQQVNLLKEK